MASDPTEQIRREMVPQINAVTRDENNQTRSKEDVRKDLEAEHGKVYSLDELQAEFDIIGFMAPIVAVYRKSDGQKGSFEYVHNPRLYFNWQPHKKD